MFVDNISKKTLQQTGMLVNHRRGRMLSHTQKIKKIAGAIFENETCENYVSCFEIFVPKREIFVKENVHSIFWNLHDKNCKYTNFEKFSIICR